MKGSFPICTLDLGINLATYYLRNQLQHYWAAFLSLCCTLTAAIRRLLFGLMVWLVTCSFNLEHFDVSNITHTWCSPA